MPTNYHAMTKRELAELAVSGDAQAALHLELRNQDDAKAEAKAKSARKALSESAVQKAIVKALDAAGWMVIRINSSVNQTDDGRYLRAYYIQPLGAAKGHADLVAYRNGRAVFLEVKTATGRQSDSQKAFEGCCRRYGMEYYIVRTPQEALDALRVGKATLTV